MRAALLRRETARTARPHAVQAPVRPDSTRPTLRIGPAGDAWEREAERVAEAVLRAPSPAPVLHPAPQSVQRCGACAGGTKCAKCKAREEEEKAALRRDGDGPAPGMTSAVEARVRAATAGGAPLEPGVRGFFEPRFGRGLDGVRVHTGARADEAARAVGARAFALGRDVVFAAGQYRPATPAGQRLLAHELAHVLQQDAGAPVLRRAPGDPPPAAETAPPAGAPAAPAPAATGFSELKVTTKDDPCACLVFMHNEERNARATAETLHQHCRYNLAIVSPDRWGQRRIDIGKTGLDRDPNELFPPTIARECRADVGKCDAFAKANAAAPTLESVQKQFYVAIDTCSRGFTLPVVALHNNSIDDTAQYIKRRKALRGAKTPKDPDEGIPTDIDKSAPPPPVKGKKKPPSAVQQMKDALVKRGYDLTKLTEESGKTNIYRWCASRDLKKCHVGDPDQPDHVVWTTNSADYDTLAAAGENVVLQTGAAKGGESDTDLSSLFLTLEGLMSEETGDRIRAIKGSRSWWDVIFDPDLRGKALDQLGVLGESLEKLRYINIETPALPYDSKTTPEQHMLEQHRAFVSTLRAAGLYCCGTTDEETAALETTIEADLKKWLEGEKERKKTKPKPKAKKTPAKK